MQTDTSAWTGEGTFTRMLIDTLTAQEYVDFLRVEDAPASRVEAGYAFVSNEIFVKFKTTPGSRLVRRLRLLRSAAAEAQVMTLHGLEARLAAVEGIGAPDYSDAGMLQYLRTERIVPPYQTRGVKVVEMIRIYEAGTPPHRT